MHEKLSQDVKAHAREVLGFDLAGIATASAEAAASGRLSRWLALGRHGEMAYMADTEAVRGDPGRFLPGAASVVCVAMAYHDPWEPPELHPRGDRLVVARYARRKDYHGVIRARLARLGRFLAARAPGARWRTACDTAPLLEKELARRAGLGWIGRNTCLIDRRLGSELLLGELVTDVPLVPDAPVPEHCGRCTACLRACPTGALRAAGEMDARLCLSYLTIEHRSSIDPRLRPALGAHVFGCDICQAVCPWNRHAPPRCAPPLRLRPRLAAPRLSELAAMSGPGWLELSAGTPLRRLDHARLRRNLAAVGGNLGGPR